ncbi:MAG: response regulator [Oscillospiraceae bacterium]|nr:response regulator [Oscillospiraceae bacterium]
MIRIIIVEDDPLVAQLNAAYLSRIEGVQVTGVFSNGQAALEHLKKHSTELAVVDVYMPICNGIELLRQIRANGIQTAVIMITAATELAVVDDALLLGIVDYLIKPFSYERLRDTVLRFRDKLSLRQGVEKANQEMVDKLMGKRTPKKANDDLPKGLNARTLTAIREVIDQSPNGEHTCESISAASGLSRVTVRHYLNYLIERDVLTSSIDYETGGRPRVLYKLK